MKKYQKKIKPKEPVKLRFRNLKGGNKSIYLEYYNGDIVRNGSHVGGKHTVLHQFRCRKQVKVML